ncbi:MAG TPA: ATP-binding cassette domain-containing protein [Planctomycetes bacterium]|nr:ATP-binding cassette domain-containing protein [Planctomycetota bacterium]HIL38160.1 ATP-binding cassette domain-containing protein [Planctomycetota bacterium]
MQRRLHRSRPDHGRGGYAPRVKPSPACSLDQVSLSLGDRTVLQSISLEVGRGEQVAILGPSGAGKTTLLRILSAGLPPSQGGVRVLDQNPWELKRNGLRSLRSRIGFVHQDHALVPNLRVWQNVAVGRLGRPGSLGHMRRMTLASRSELRDLHDILEQVGIADLLFQRTADLSGGEQQRVAIARSLYQEPALLLADEPVASVDPARAQQVMDLLVGLANSREIPLVISLHDLELARRNMSRLIGLREGRVLFDSAPKEVSEGKIKELYALPSQENGAP